MGIIRTDVLVVGGGIIGSSIAYYLAQNNVDVCLIDRLEPVSGTSSACDGFVFIQSKRPGMHLKLAKASRHMYENLTKILGEDIEYEKKGSLVIIENEHQLAERKKMLIIHRAEKLDVRLLTTYQALSLEPLLSQNIYGATYAPDDAQVNPIHVTYAYLKQAKAKGAKVIPGCELAAIKIKKTKADEAITTRGRIKFKTIINAAGVSAGTVSKMIGVDLPIQPRRGQILVTEPVDKMINKLIACHCYLEAKFGNDTKLAGTTIEQTRSGNLLIGSTREHLSSEKTVTCEGLKAIAEHAAGIIPATENLKIIRAFAGIRPYNPEGLPILSRTETMDNFINACGHDGDGITLAPITGKLIADLVINSRQAINTDIVEELCNS